MSLSWSSVRRRLPRTFCLPKPLASTHARPLASTHAKPLASTRPALWLALLVPLFAQAGLARALPTRSPYGTPPPRQAATAPQSLSFPALPAPAYAGTAVTLAATASSGLPVSYTVLSGPATVSGGVLTYTAPGTVVVEATQPGNASFSPAPPQQQTVTAGALTAALGATSPVLTTVVTITAPGALSTPTLLTLGAPGTDFALAPGGTCTAGTTYTAGQTCTVAFTFAPTHPGLRLGGISLATAGGTLLGNGYVFALGSGPQVSFLPGTQSTLGSGLGQPSGVTQDGHGNLFVSSLLPPALLEITPAGTTTGLGSFTEADDVAVDGSGDVFVISGRTTLSELVAVNGTLPANPVIRTLSTGFQALNGITVDGTGDVFLASGFQGGAASAVYEVEAVNGTIPDTPTLRTLPGSFGGPTGVAVDVYGNVFVSDEGRSAVYEIEAVNGVIPAAPTIRQLGSGFNQPSNVSVDGNGNVFVADFGNRVAREIVAVNGTIPATGATILTFGAGLSSPQGLGLDAAGNLLIADSGQPLITRIDTADPPTLTFASTPVGLTSTDSPQTVTLLNSGNAPLVFQPPATGLNPAITPGFTLGNSSTCPLLSPGTTAAPVLTPGAACTDVVSFAPVAPGTDNGTLTTTDNALSSFAGVQTVPLHAVGIADTLTATLTATPNPVFLENPVTLTAVIASNTGTPGGTVLFADAGITLGSATLNNGVATLTVSTLGLGTHPITASYTSASFGGVTSTPVSVLVEDFRITLANPAVTIAHGGTATYTLTLTPIGGPTMPSAITLSTTGAPDFSTITFSPQPVAAGSGVTAVTLTIQTPNFPVGPWARTSPAVYGRSQRGLPLAALCLLLPFVRRRHLPASLRRLAQVCLLLAGLGAMLSLAGCGSGWKAQAYSFSITGSAGPLTHAVTATLTSQ